MPPVHLLRLPVTAVQPKHTKTVLPQDFMLQAPLALGKLPIPTCADWCERCKVAHIRRVGSGHYHLLLVGGACAVPVTLCASCVREVGTSPQVMHITRVRAYA